MDSMHVQVIATPIAGTGTGSGESKSTGTESIVVTTAAGNYERIRKDGLGRSASLNVPNALCYSSTLDALLILESGSLNGIRCLFVATPQRQSALHQHLR